MTLDAGEFGASNLPPSWPPNPAAVENRANQESGWKPLLRLPMHPHGRVYLLPSIGGFLGGEGQPQAEDQRNQQRNVPSGPVRTVHALLLLPSAG
jgi:hypothetical protein